ncbi:MarR family winged helix-turn-helix transcriptional regulator [Salinisphaera dokdonensis]
MSKPHHARATTDTETADGELDQSPLLSLVGYQLRRADIAMRQTFTRDIVNVFNLRPVEFSVLVLLKHNSQVTHKRLSQALDVAPSNMVAVVGRLKKDGLLTRARNPSDGRSIILKLTAKGETLETEVRSAVEHMEAEALASWKNSEHEQLLELLQRVRP